MNSEDAKGPRMKQESSSVWLKVTVLLAVALLSFAFWRWVELRNAVAEERRALAGRLRISIRLHESLARGDTVKAQRDLGMLISGQLRTLTEKHGLSVASNLLGDHFAPAKTIADEVNARLVPLDSPKDRLNAPESQSRSLNKPDSQE